MASINPVPNYSHLSALRDRYYYRPGIKKDLTHDIDYIANTSYITKKLIMQTNLCQQIYMILNCMKIGKKEVQLKGCP